MRPPLLEVLERLDGEDDAAVAVEALDERVDLLVGRPAREPPLDRVREHRDRERRRQRVDERAPGRRRAPCAASSALANVPETFEETWSE